jgi:2'-5' RNA ligase
MGRKVRTFIALHVPEEVREEMIPLQERLGHVAENLRMVAPANMHLTLKFVGDWEENRLGDLCEGARRAASRVNPFRLLFGGVDVFPHIRRPRVVILKCASQPPSALSDLHSELEGELAPLGVKPEGRVFRPHLTIARVKGRGGRGLADLVLHLGGFEAGTGEAAELGVFLSDLTPRGPVYSRVGAARLGGG